MEELEEFITTYTDADDDDEETFDDNIVSSSAYDDYAELNPRQQKALAFMLAGMSIKKTAQMVGVTPNTITRWSKMPAWLRARQEYLERAADRVLEIFCQHAEAVAHVFVDMAVNKKNLVAGKVILEAVGALKHAGIHGGKPQSLQQLLQSIKVDVKVGGKSKDEAIGEAF